MSKGSARIRMARVGVVRLLRLWYLVEFGWDEGSLSVLAWREGCAARRPGSVTDLVFDLSLPKDLVRL